LVYGEPDLFDLAAAYARGLARNHPFIDGNKRVALMASMCSCTGTAIGSRHPKERLWL
jgi:death-on-curing protein